MGDLATTFRLTADVGDLTRLIAQCEAAYRLAVLRGHLGVAWLAAEEQAAAREQLRKTLQEQGIIMAEMYIKRWPGVKVVKP